MDDVIDLGKLLHDTPDLLPWVVLAIIIVFLVSQRKRIVAYFDARIDSYSAKKESDALMGELVRNNTAALDNNTAALESNSMERHDIQKLVEFHESMSCERMNHIQTTVDQIHEMVTTNSKGISVIEERTDK